MIHILNHYFVALVLGAGFGAFAASIQALPRAVAASLLDKDTDNA